MSPFATVRVGRLMFPMLAVLCAAGCGTHHISAEVPPAPAGTSAAAQPAPAPAPAPASAPAKPPGTARTLEGTDRRLAEALLRATAFPSADTHRAVAIEYRRLGVLDKAFDHFADAVAADSADAVSHEGMARIWRDWGMPQLGLGAAYRAVHFAPESASAANTLGTLLQAVGHLPEAESWYGKARTLDPKAWYALNNICYVQILRRQPAAVGTCQRAAAEAGPDARTAENNLALALAARGDMPGAKQWFRRANEPAVAAYNYGITLMATRDYAGAADAFTEALTDQPTSRLAAARVRQAHEAEQRHKESSR